VGKRLAMTLASLALVGGYAAADIYDVAPGILTRTTVTPLPAPPASGGPSPTFVPLPTAGAATVLSEPPPDAPEPRAAKLAERLKTALADPALGPSVGVSVRDAVTGTELYARDTATARVVASTQKILTAAAVTQVLDPTQVMTTKVVSPEPGELVLVAGGDTLLARGAGDPEVTAGHAGLGDLAAQVTARIARSGAPSWRLRLDNTYAAGPGYPDTPAYPTGWNPADVAAGYTQSVAMLGFADQRPKPGKPSPSDPAGAVLAAFADMVRAALAKAGSEVEVTVSDTPKLRATPVPAAATELGAVESAPYRDVLAEALDESDNALTENLARQAAVQAGEDGSFSGNAAFVTAQLRTLGFDLTGTTLTDTSGLARGQHSTVALLSAVTAKAVVGGLPGLDDALGRLPVAGLDGTLYDRFRTEPASQAAGLARAKTGTLTGISGLLGTTVDADDRQLIFVIVADQVPPSMGTLAARAALDRFVAALTACGCG